MRILVALTAALAVLSMVDANAAFVEQMLASSTSAEEAENLAQFKAWLLAHGKKYESLAESHARFENFLRSREYVDKVNAANGPMQLELNHLADTSDEEYRNMQGLVVDDNELAESSKEAASAKVSVKGFQATGVWHKSSGGSLKCKGGKQPSLIDWRKEGVVSEVHSQGPCGTCWSFVARDAIESYHMLAQKAAGKKPVLVKLSNQHLIDCAEKKQGYPDVYCYGGMYRWAFQMVQKTGIAALQTYAHQYQCNTFHDKHSCAQQCVYQPTEFAATVNGYYNIKMGSEDDLVDALQKGPVAVGIDAHHMSFKFYKSGVWNEQSCSKTKLTHAMLVVGYHACHDSPKDDYYIVKNSWGEKYGQDGFIKIPMHNNQCGIAMVASYPKVTHGTLLQEQVRLQAIQEQQSALSSSTSSAGHESHSHGSGLASDPAADLNGNSDKKLTEESMDESGMDLSGLDEEDSEGEEYDTLDDGDFFA